MRQYIFRGKNILSEHWHKGSLRIANNGQCFISSYGQHSHFDEVEVEPETVGQMVEIVAREKYQLFEGDIVKVKKASVNKYDFHGVVFFNDATFCLKRITQSDSAIKHGYIDLIRFWKDGCHDHHSLEMLCDGYCEIEIVGNIHVDLVA